MYGLINMAIKQLVLDNFGESGWQKVLDESQVKQNYFELLTVYEDDVTYKLVQGACAVTGMQAPDILKLFGKYWVNYAAVAGYEPLLKLFGPTLKECLFNLNKMHEHMGAMMPGLIPPEFNIEKEISSNEIILLYGSKRPGLSPMVSGLLEGLALRYNVQNLNVSPLGKTPDEAYERFLVKWN
jgi:hypothetical protein